MQSYVLRLKEKSVVIEGEQESTVAAEKPSVTIEAQLVASSFSSAVVQ